MMQQMQKLLDRARAHNEDARAVAQAAADLAAERTDIIAAFGELGIKPKKAGREIVSLSVKLIDVGAEAPEEDAPPPDMQIDYTPGYPTPPEKPFDPIEDRPAFLTRQK